MKTNYQNASLTDMVFEGRNQAYGAYVLRRDHDRSLQQAIFLTLSAVLLFCLGNYLHDKLSKSATERTVMVDVTTSDIGPKPPQPQKQEIKLPPQKQESKAKAGSKDLEQKVVHSNTPPEDSIPATRDLQKAEAGLTTNLMASLTGIGSPDGNGNGKTFEVQKSVPVAVEDVPTRTPDVMPVFPGGDKALMAYLAKNTEYPSQLRDIGISGQVISEFTINENGTVSDVHIIRSPASGFDREVTRVLRTLPAFSPGLQNGHPVKVRYVVPVFFKLSE